LTSKQGKFKCLACNTVWEQDQLVGDAFERPFTQDGEVIVEKLSCGYFFCGGSVVRLPDDAPSTLVVYEGPILKNPPPPEDEFPYYPD
jgi:hypothetical protein